MREIKFRAWFCGGMSDEFVIIDPNYKSIGCPINAGIADFLAHDDPSSPMIIMQYTGLKDKNGKEIYEGDIIRKYPGFGCEWEPHICVVEWRYAGFMEKRKSGHACQLDDHDSANEVIGNIYENPELMSST